MGQSFICLLCTVYWMQWFYWKYARVCFELSWAERETHKRNIIFNAIHTLRGHTLSVVARIWIGQKWQTGIEISVNKMRILKMTDYNICLFRKSRSNLWHHSLYMRIFFHCCSAGLHCAATMCTSSSEPILSLVFQPVSDKCRQRQSTFHLSLIKQLHYTTVTPRG